MRRLRNAWINLRRLARRARRPPSAAPTPRPPGPPRVDFSYTIYWTKQARAWDADRRASVLHALGPVLSQPDFEANLYARRFSVPGLDEHAHAGASLLALRKVLLALQDEHPTPKAED
jgi:hypothetical protein